MELYPFCAKSKAFHEHKYEFNWACHIDTDPSSPTPLYAYVRSPIPVFSVPETAFKCKRFN